MRIPILRGVIDRRILVNYRVDAEVLADVLPEPFEPKLVSGVGIAGICLIRLKRVRPRMFPGCVGIASENAAHRIAVQWRQDGCRHEGVYIPRRDTSSRFNALVGGKLFPGVHHHARFAVREETGFYAVGFASDDGRTHAAVRARPVDRLPEESVFGSLDEASDFFRCGSLGFSATATPGRFDGLELRCLEWRVRPLAVETVESSFFDDENSFPPGSVEFDSALLMHGIEHEWHGKPCLVADERLPAAGRASGAV